MAAGAPDIIKVQTDRQSSSEKRGLFVSGHLYRAPNSWALCIAVFLIAAAASFAAAVLFSGNHLPKARVLLAATPPSLALLPTIEPALSDQALEAQASKRVMDDTSAFDEVHHSHARRSRIDESAAYDPTKAKTSTSPTARSSKGSKDTNQIDSSKVNPRTNW